MPCPSVVRRATISDHNECWRLFLMGHRENGLFTLAPDKVEFFLRRALQPQLISKEDTGPRGEVAVIGSNGKLEAICFVIIGQFWYSTELHVEELILYVDPESRKSEHAKSLIKWMKDTADDLSIPLITGIMSTERTEAKTRLYDRYLPRIGSFYCYPLVNTDIKKRNHNMEHESWRAAQRHRLAQ